METGMPTEHKEMVDEVAGAIVGKCSEPDLLAKTDFLEQAQDSDGQLLAAFLAGANMGSTAVAREWFRNSPRDFMAYYARRGTPAPIAAEARDSRPPLRTTYRSLTLPAAVAVTRVVLEDHAVAIVSERLTAEEQRIARAIVAYPALAHGTSVIVLRQDTLLEAIAEASTPTEEWPTSNA